jgi:hypothetical protein
MSGAVAIAAASAGDSGGGFGGGGDICVGPRGILRRGLREACMRPCWTWSGSRRAGERAARR